MGIYRHLFFSSDSASSAATRHIRVTKFHQPHELVDSYSDNSAFLKIFRKKYQWLAAVFLQVFGFFRAIRVAPRKPMERKQTGDSATIFYPSRYSACVESYAEKCTTPRYAETMNADENNRKYFLTNRNLYLFLEI